LSITILNRLAQCNGSPTTLVEVVQKRSRNPDLKAFGRRLLELRAGRSRQQIVNQLAAPDIQVRFDASTLFQYEAGTVWSPDIGVLWGLAKVYEVPLDHLVDLLRANRANPQADSEEWRQLAPAEVTSAKKAHGRTKTDGENPYVDGVTAGKTIAEHVRGAPRPSRAAIQASLSATERAAVAEALFSIYVEFATPEAAGELDRARRQVLQTRTQKTGNRRRRS
jgi:transcriptional regulator with XRE-family HTH domain